MKGMPQFETCESYKCLVRGVSVRRLTYDFFMFKMFQARVWAFRSSNKQWTSELSDAICLEVGKFGIRLAQQLTSHILSFRSCVVNSSSCCLLKKMSRDPGNDLHAYYNTERSLHLQNTLATYDKCLNMSLLYHSTSPFTYVPSNSPAVFFQNRRIPKH